jgi:hypothetical protein
MFTRNCNKTSLSQLKIRLLKEPNFMKPTAKLPTSNATHGRSERRAGYGSNQGVKQNSEPDKYMLFTPAVSIKPWQVPTQALVRSINGRVYFGGGSACENPEPYQFHLIGAQGFGAEEIDAALDRLHSLQVNCRQHLPFQRRVAAPNGKFMERVKCLVLNQHRAESTLPPYKQTMVRHYAPEPPDLVPADKEWIDRIDGHSLSVDDLY